MGLVQEEDEGGERGEKNLLSFNFNSPAFIYLICGQMVVKQGNPFVQMKPTCESPSVM